ncbi:MAG: hypothetical protein SH868_04600 [Bythopirellula sp.]|nr:hypothetical protein [Bythopirellula sp.]
MAFISTTKSRADELVAFPGAVGQGASASGGRGGDVYHVTNLEDYHPKNETKIEGSLRHAIRSAESPRTIVFDVSGAIALHAPLEILKSDLTIAGQTAPGDGITLWGYPVEVSKGSNVIVRYLRVRLGDFHARIGDSTKPHPYAGNNDLDPGSANALFIGGGCNRVIFDHVSASWGMDETFSVTTCKNVTVQNCIIAHSLNDSFHPKGPHGYGSLVRGELTPEDQAANTGGFTFYQNLWAHHRARNPSLGGQQKIGANQSEAERRSTDVNLINNVIYNWQDQPTHRSELGKVRINMLGNAYICGPAKPNERVFREGDKDVSQVFHVGNYVDADQDELHDGHVITTPQQVAKSFQNFGEEDQLLSAETSKPFAFMNDVAKNVKSVGTAYHEVLNSVGCSLIRDAIDEALIQSVIHRKGKLIDSQEEIRDNTGNLVGLDDLRKVQRPADFDTDSDGLPNEFEIRNKLNPDDSSDGNGTNLSNAGYTNLDVYLNELTERL